MSRKIVSVEMDDTLKVVKDIFDHTRFHHLLVVDDDKLMGVLSDRDLIKAISPRIGTLSETIQDSATLKKRVHQIMSRKPVSLPGTATVNDAIDIFNHQDISCIPIVNENREPVGIISWRDIFKHLKVN